ncbi:tubulin-specific chaperone [Niveomyces insectorum RCEF 264]|uniref:Tubulin-specific chaperone n=1 Tax=Niveomyces insectorum RCEF 264 TaxID=1081102 RepID=A0A167S3S6_9HYPO|nr:tubulin-specific chaperone [Niveomyces insectorum RCEF 264]
MPSNVPNVVSLTQTYPFAFAGPKPIMDPKERFYRQFQLEVANIQGHINRLGSVATVGGERKDATDSILASISKLSLDVADAADYIPAYDQRSYSAAVKSLTDQLNEQVARLAPKARFQFKRNAAKAGDGAPAVTRQNDPRLLRGVPSAPTTAPTAAGPTEAAGESTSAAIPVDAVSDLPSFPAKNYNAEITRPTPLAGATSGSGGGSGSNIRKPSFSTAREVAIAGHVGLHIILPLAASRATASGSLTDLHSCVVDMSVPTSGSSSSSGSGGSSTDGYSSTAFLSLVLKNIDRSLIVAGHVNGPVHITGIRDSVLVVAARQVRIHECSNVDVYLYCGSRPIIEDCHGMRFAPIPTCYMKNRDDAKNQWNQVDDFKWLKADHSPNWCVLPEAERLPETVWTGIVAGGPGLNTEDVLKAVGIGKG